MDDYFFFGNKLNDSIEWIYTQWIMEMFSFLWDKSFSFARFVILYKSVCYDKNVIKISVNNFA